MIRIGDSRWTVICSHQFSSVVIWIILLWNRRYINSKLLKAFSNFLIWHKCPSSYFSFLKDPRQYDSSSGPVSEALLVSPINLSVFPAQLLLYVHPCLHLEQAQEKDNPHNFRSSVFGDHIMGSESENNHLLGRCRNVSFSLGNGILNRASIQRFFWSRNT